MDKQSWMVKYPSWQPQVLAALIETDRERLRVKVVAAEEAMCRRGLELTSKDDMERTAMRDASRQLRALMITVLGYPPVAWESKSNQQHN